MKKQARILSQRIAIMESNWGNLKFAGIVSLVAIFSISISTLLPYFIK